MSNLLTSLSRRQKELKDRIDEAKKQPRPKRAAREPKRWKTSTKMLGLPGWVYAVKIADGPVKIGITVGDSPFDRLYHIGQALPYTLEIIGFTFHMDASAMEDFLHRKFVEKRIKGEWFNLDGQEIATLFTEHGFITKEAVESILQQRVVEAMKRAERHAKTLRGEI